MINDCLSIFPEQPIERIPLATWQICYLDRDTGLEYGLHTGNDHEGLTWENQMIPGLLRATTGRDSVWYRCVFDYQKPTAPLLVLLRFGGCFLDARVWLNGREIGRHYGYFAPWSLDASSNLRDGENLLVVNVQSPVETGNLYEKRNIMGVFNDWDCKPYPNKASFSLPKEYEWWVPLGFWAPVSLDLCGPVIVESVQLIPQFPDSQWRVVDGRLHESKAQVMLRMRLRNMTSEPQRLRIGVEVTPHNFNDEWHYTNDESLLLSAGQMSDLGAIVEIPQAALWFPWSQGAPNLYRCTLTFKWGGKAISLSPLTITRTFGMREVQARIQPEEGEGRQRSWEWWLNGRRIFPKGSNYIADFMIDGVRPDIFRHDIELAREANMDMLRVHAHIAPPAFYQIADEAGMMVFADFPLTFCYGYKQSDEVQEWIRQAMLAQLPEMVDLLQTHPSIVLWSVHNEPPWPEQLAWFGEPHQLRLNKEMDEEGKRLLAELDPSRPAIAASGDIDEHIYDGWYWNSLADVRNLHPIFPTEFGAQALPNRDSPFWEHVKTEWPVDPEEPSWCYADYQPLQWAQFGVGEPQDYATLEEYITESQRYQAALCAYCIDQFRLKKFQPCGGIVHFMLTDCFPSITWAVLDYYRQPKLAYEAIKHAYEPTHVIIDWDGDWEFQQHYKPAFTPGSPMQLRMYVVNDSPYTMGEVELRWTLRQVGAGGSLWGKLRHSWSRVASKAHRFTLPKTNESALMVAEINDKARAGDYELEVMLRQGDRVLEQTILHYRVGKYPRPKHRKTKKQGKMLQIPGFMVYKLYEKGSLTNDDVGSAFRFALKNSLQNAVVTGLLHLKIDDQPVPVDTIQVVVDEETIPASSITATAPLNVPVGRRILVRVAGKRLAPSLHAIELGLRIPGFGDGVVRVKDTLATK